MSTSLALKPTPTNPIIRVDDWVTITRGIYRGHYGQVIRIADGLYHVTGGSISLHGELAPVFDRTELRKNNP